MKNDLNYSLSLDHQGHCPCCSGMILSFCCKPFILGNKKPDTAEQLMRSRYTAYATYQWEYIYNSWHAKFRGPTVTPEGLAKSMSNLEWKKLDILFSQGGKNDQKGIVEFQAWYAEHKEQDLSYCLSERSNFLKDNGAWFYTTGVTHTKQLTKKAKIETRTKI